MEDNVRMNLRETVWEVMDWIHVAQDRDHGNEPSDWIEAGKFLDYLSNC
jgi:hypothetical protein